jgi:glycosyltransferase involved in cell wall biosynthesis
VPNFRNRSRRARDLLAGPAARVRSLWEEVRTERKVGWLLGLAERCDFDEGDLARNREQLARAARLDAPIRTVNWYVPAFEHAFYGGIHTILRFASGWRTRHGVESRFLVHDEPGASAGALGARVASAFPDLVASRVVVLPSREPLPPADLGIATLWTGAFHLLKDGNVARKLYFLQDDERLFHAAGTQSALAGATWRFGFPALVNTPGLRDVYARETGAPAFAFVPAVDPAVFHPPRQPRAAAPFRVFFYARPRIDRNAFELGISALALLRRRRGSAVEVVAAGAGVPRGLVRRFPEIEFRGLLPYAATGDLYRSCHAGLALMMTRHPSYLPLELMACGAVPVVNVNPDDAWLLRHHENAVVCEPTVTALAQGMERLAGDPALLGRLSAAGPATVAHVRWDDQVDAALEFARIPAAFPGR